MKKLKTNRTMWIILFVMVAGVTIFSKIKEKGGSGHFVDGHKGGYIMTDYVRGVTFDVPESFIQNAATESVMSREDSEYLYGWWLIKNADTSYKLFNYNNVVIIARKGTDFTSKTQSGELKDMLRVSNLDGTWFSFDEDEDFNKSGEDNGGHKILANVVGDVTINPQFYGKYFGRLAIVSKDGEEWSLFVGVCGSDYETLSAEAKNVVSHVAASFRFDPEYGLEGWNGDAGPAVSGEPAPSSVPDTAEPTQETTPEPTATQMPTATPAPTATPVPTSTPVPTATQAPTATPEPTATPVPTATHVPTATPVPTKAPVTPVVTAAPTRVPTPLPTKAPTPVPTKAPVITSKPSMESSAKASSLSSPLSVGEVGKVSIKIPESSKDGYVRVDSVNIRNDATDILRSVLGSEYTEAPAAQKWVVIEFSSTLSVGDGFIDSVLLGADGNPLVMGGVINSTDTHQITRKVTQSGNEYNHYYLYYPIPNGFKSTYVIRFGIEGGQCWYGFSY